MATRYTTLDGTPIRRSTLPARPQLGMRWELLQEFYDFTMVLFICETRSRLKFPVTSAHVPRGLFAKIVDEAMHPAEGLRLPPEHGVVCASVLPEYDSSEGPAPVTIVFYKRIPGDPFTYVELGFINMPLYYILRNITKFGYDEPIFRDVRYYQAPQDTIEID